jgi:hypothetical protein
MRLSRQAGTECALSDGMMIGAALADEFAFIASVLGGMPWEKFPWKDANMVSTVNTLEQLSPSDGAPAAFG